jgi:hypothetical protein
MGGLGVGVLAKNTALIGGDNNAIGVGLAKAIGVKNTSEPKTRTLKSSNPAPLMISLMIFFGDRLGKILK